MYPKQYYQGIATLTGCVIGAGILGIPYVVQKAGFWTGMLALLIVGVAMLIVHVMVGDIAMASRKCSQLVGYAQEYLGKKGKFLMLASMVVGIYGAMAAYTLGVSASLAAVFGGSQLAWGILYYVIVSAVLLGGVSVLGKSELWMEAVKMVAFITIIVILFSSTHFSTANLQGFEYQKLFVPYGILVFAYLGTAAVPELCEEMRSCRRLARRAIVIGSLIPIIAYSLFTIGVIGVTGRSTTEIATLGIAGLAGTNGAIVFHLFAILAMATSFIALAFALKEAYWKDVGMSHLNAWGLALTVPALLLSLGVHSFVRTLEITGSFAGGLAGVLIVIMHAKSIGKRKILHFVLATLFIIGTLYQLLS